MLLEPPPVSRAREQMATSLPSGLLTQHPRATEGSTGEPGVHKDIYIYSIHFCEGALSCFTMREELNVVFFLFVPSPLSPCPMPRTETPEKSPHITDS